MEVPLNKIKSQLSHYIRRAHEGEQVIITRYGKPIAELHPIHCVKSPTDKLAALYKIMKKASQKTTGGYSAARSADFLYGDDGIPR